MGFFDDFVSAAEDVGGVFIDVNNVTARIVTDTALDLGNLVTGEEYNADFEKAKKKLSDVGLKDLGEVIEKNHYSFLKPMEKEAEAKLLNIRGLHGTGTQLEAELDDAMEVLNGMCADISALSDEGKRAREQLAVAMKIPNWEKWSTTLDIPPESLGDIETVNAASVKWEKVGNDLVTANLILGSAELTFELSGLAAVAAAGRMAKAGKAVTNASKTAGYASKASKFVKFGKLAGRASAVLAVASIGLEAGLAVAELEKKETALKDQLAKLDSGIAEIKSGLEALRNEVSKVKSSITALILTVNLNGRPWDDWVEEKRQSLRELCTRLVSVEGITERAMQMARASRGKPWRTRVDLVSSVDPSIDKGEAALLLLDLDSELAGAAKFAANLSGKTIMLRSWKNDYLQRVDESDKISTGSPAEPGALWKVEGFDGGLRLKSAEGDYLHRPDGAAQVTTWQTGVGNDWVLEVIEGEKVRLRSSKKDCLHRPDGPARVTTWQAGSIGNHWVVEYA